MEFEMGYTERLGRRQLREKMNSHKKFEGKLKTILKTTFTVQNTRFSRLKWVANKTLGQATKTLKDKILKNFISVFRDWKVYPWGSRELSRENLCVTLTTGPSTREQVAKIDMRAHDCGMRLDLPATESPKQGKNVFWNFQFL